MFGYYLEVTKSNLEEVPANYIRKQTLANCERYITTELQDLAELILGSEEKIVELEYQLFVEIGNAIAAEVEPYKNSKYHFCGRCVEMFWGIMDTQNYTKPVVDDGDVLDIIGGRDIPSWKATRTVYSK